MTVAPFLPRSGTPFIPRPALGVTVTKVDDANIEVVATDFLDELGGATMRASIRIDALRADGTFRRVTDNHQDIPPADSVTSPVGVGAGFANGSLRVRVLSSYGQQGVWFGVPPAAVTVSSTVPGGTSTVSGGTANPAPPTGKVVIEDNLP